ncbi:MAG: hypothetical protein OZ921_01090 [Sorangiineae bacterium]|nr:hypothetical protein [Polyangiaceae bacterium]MEB2321079.1 hypothetical protein [Sorangiineae bacterium]
MANLYVVLDAASVRAVRALARHPELRGDHVTLAFQVDPADFTPAWVPGGGSPGDIVELRAIGHAADARVQALLIEQGGLRTRPWDGGTLHVTVSRQPWARSRDSNALLASGTPEPLELALSGVIAWS